MAFQIQNKICLLNKTQKPNLFVNATGIWSLKLRQTTYAGPCLRIRRSSDSVEQDFYADQNGNLGTTVGATGTSFATWLGANTAFVTIWYDQSGQTNHMYQTTTASQPTFTVANGIIFNGTSNYFETSAYSATLNTAKFTIITLSVNLNNTAYGALYASRSSGATLRGFTSYKLDSTDNSNNWGIQYSQNSITWNNNASTVTATSGKKFAIAYNLDTASNVVSTIINKTDNTAAVTKSVTASNYLPALSVNTRIGAGRTENVTPSFYYNGYITDVFYFNTNISNSQQTTILNLL